jgi:flavodoxin
MKALIAYYSRSGTTKKAAETLAAILKCDVEELADRKGSKSRKGLFGWLRCGKEAMKRMLPPIERAKKNPADYGLVIIGTPIWASNMSSPVRTYLSENKGRMEKAAFFCTMGGESTGKTFVEMEEACSKKPVACLGLRKAGVKKGIHSQKIKEFARKITR